MFDPELKWHTSCELLHCTWHETSLYWRHRSFKTAAEATAHTGAEASTSQPPSFSIHCPCSIHVPWIILDHHLSCDLQRPFACQCFLLDRLHQRNGSTGTIELQRQVHLKADAFTATATDVQRQHGRSCSCSHRSETGGVEHEPQNLIRNMTNLPKVEKKHHYTHYTMTYENLWAIECM